MKKRNTGLILAIILCVWITETHAQNIHETTPASGGEATGSGGSVSYSVGQIVYQTNTSINYSEAQGIQQPYELSVTEISEEGNGFAGEISVFPNPTDGNLWVSYDNNGNQSINYQLTDIEGRLIYSNVHINQDVNINLCDLPAGAYFLLIFNEKNETKSFKIIKN